MYNVLHVWAHTGYAISGLQIFLCQKWQQNVFLLNCVIVLICIYRTLPR